MINRGNPSTGQGHDGFVREPPAMNQQKQCILGVGGNSCQKIVEVRRPLLAEWAWVIRLSDSSAPSGLSKGNRFRLEFQLISQDALHLLVSCKMCLKLPCMFLISKGIFPSKIQ